MRKAKEIRSGKKGSAILIVLGMFSFMLVSAVAFSMYMRATRAPSSYVRRNATVRQLAKAALARAMDEIDCAIGNDPFPGVGYNHKDAEPVPSESRSFKNLVSAYDGKNDNWHGRVFTPLGGVAMKYTSSTLTLEALGYIPAPLVNEARYWSRHTRTAKWHPFSYGMGQYAFTAINVSDFFDLGALYAKDDDGIYRQYLNRSSAPHGRISPTYLFRNGENADMDTGNSAARKFLESLRGIANLDTIPLVSLMDYNLGMDGAKGSVRPPFLANGGGYIDSSISRADALTQMFMAGGWNGDSNLTYNAYSKAHSGMRGCINLRYPEYQPFSDCPWFPEATTLAHCFNDISIDHPFWKMDYASPETEGDFPVIAGALLCDYLDYDSVPLSLCIPCTEAVPMICGVELNDKCVKLETQYVMGPVVAVGTPPTSQTRTDTCNLLVTVDFNPTITVVYPFKYKQPDAPDYEIECYARIFFEEEQTTADSDLNDSGLRDPFFDLGTLDPAWGTLKAGVAGTSFIEVKCSAPLSIKDNLDADESKAVIEKTLRASVPSTVKTLATLDLEDLGTGWKFKSATDPGQIDFYPRGSLGVKNGVNQRIDFASTFAGTAGIKYRPMVAMWVRIKDSNGKTVDMAPAMPAYDNMNGFPENKDLAKFNVAATGNSTPACPAFRFFPEKAQPGIVPDRTGGGPFDGLSSTPPVVRDESDWKQKTYIANDPRINWAPEQWWADRSSSPAGNKWLKEVESFQNNDVTRDSDIFMSASNQGYLQSMYEWMMIPQVKEIRKERKIMPKLNEWGCFETGGGYNGTVRSAIGDVAHANVMWRTYKARAFLDDGTDENRTAYDWGRLDLLPFEEPENGLRVNPYTDITNIMLGAIANMPRDWWAAGTNHYVAGKGYMRRGTSSFEDSYLFDWSCNNRDAYRMAQFWMSAFREKDSSRLYMNDEWMRRLEGYTGGSRDILDWRDGNVYYSTPASGDVRAILQDLTLVERKYLYGYLKGCFANTSQLFLVFVRAEAEAGGGGAGSGARAVALVWRDPAAPLVSGSKVSGAGQDNAGDYLSIGTSSSTAGESVEEVSWRYKDRKYPPHRMQVLFYHQLD